jgi:hypothetical protein
MEPENDVQRQVREAKQRTEDSAVPFLQCLAAQGYPFTSIWQMRETANKQDRVFVECALECLANDKDNEFIFWMIPWVRKIGIRFDGQAFLRIMERDLSEGERWTVAECLSAVKLTGAEPYVRRELALAPERRVNQVLVMAAARKLPAEEARTLITPVLPYHPGHAAEALGICGGKAELELLRAWLESPAAKTVHKWVIRSFNTAIRRIERRLGKDGGSEGQ